MANRVVKMPLRRKILPNQKELLEWEYDPYRTLKPQIKRLLNEIVADYENLIKSGTPLDYRLAAARYAAEAKGILHVAQASDAVFHRRDIL